MYRYLLRENQLPTNPHHSQTAASPLRPFAHENEAEKWPKTLAKRTAPAIVREFLVMVDRWA